MKKKDELILFLLIVITLIFVWDQDRRFRFLDERVTNIEMAK